MKETNGEHQRPKFKHIQKLIADKLERSIAKKEAIADGCFVKAPTPAPPATLVIPDATTTRMGRKPTPNSSLPPPPPPMPPSIPSRPIAKANNNQRAPAFVKLFHSLKNQEGVKSTTGSVKQQKPVAVPVNVHSSIVGEIQNRSAHLLAVSIVFSSSVGGYTFSVCFNLDMHH